MYGLTSDGRELLYNGSTGRKLVNVNTAAIREITITGGQAYTNTSRWNDSGYCSGETGNIIWVYNLLSDERHSIKTPATPYYAHFSADGKRFYFMCWIHTMESIYAEPAICRKRLSSTLYALYHPK